MGYKLGFKTRSIVTVCLFIGQLVAVSPARGETDALVERAAPPLASANSSATAAEYARVFDLAFRIMQHRIFYDYLNKAFSASIQRPTGSRGGLSLSQIVFILLNARQHWEQIESYLKQVPVDSASDDRVLEIRAKFRTIFEQFAGDAKLMKFINAHNDATQPLLLNTARGAAGYTKMDMFVNHPSLENPNRQDSRILPGADLRKLVLDFIEGAEEEIYYNIYDFDLKPIAEALIQSNRRGVRIHGGIDKGVAEMRPEVAAIYKMLRPFQAKGLKTTLVDSVGLNHQKMIVRDPLGPKAAVLLLSGNFTQSCIGPEGDAVGAEGRPRVSIPNANHAVLIRGQIPAVVVRQELKKTLDYGVRGQSQYPLGGAFQIQGPKDANGKPTWIILTFSPNGGLGEINRDILSRLIQMTSGPMFALQFVFSSPTLLEETMARVAAQARKLKASGRPAKGLFYSVGDTSFAMRRPAIGKRVWSAFLILSGLLVDNNNRYIENSKFPLRRVFNADEWSAWREDIRVAPAVYGDRQVQVGGQMLHITSKIHHKVFFFPNDNVSVVGTSFNPSLNAESNNEQILIVKDSVISHRTQQMFAYLYKESKGSVYEEAKSRNERPITNEPAREDSESRAVVRALSR